jgi:hypothetical protein
MRESPPAETEESSKGSAGGETPARRRMIKLLIFAGGAVAGFAGKTGQEFFTPQDAADQVRTAIGSSNPLSVAAIPEHYADTQGFTWVLPAALPTTVGAIPRYDDASFDSWVAQNGGVDVWFTYVKLVVENRWSNPVSITDIRAVVKRQPPLHGTLLWAPPQGAGVLTRFGFNLDDAQPVARTAVDNMDEVIQGGDLGMNSLLVRSPYLSSNKVDLAHRERETFEVIAGTTQSYCEFTIRVAGLVGERPFTQEISNLGGPFKVTAPARPTSSLNNLDKSAYAVVYENDYQRWRRSKG